VRWQELKPSDNVEDRRGLRMPGGPVGGGVGVLVVVVIALLAGVDPRGLLQNVGLTGSGSPPPAAVPAADDTMH
jgi:predicted metalloprotease